MCERGRRGWDARPNQGQAFPPGAIIGRMTQCAVQRCPNQATKPHTLRRDAMGIPTEVAVCQHHADELTDPYAEWMYDYSKDPVTNQFNASVLTGESLQGLDEYIVTAAPDTVRLYTPAARIYSHQDHNGVHVPFM
jgi:hypothetical protein